MRLVTNNINIILQLTSAQNVAKAQVNVNDVTLQIWMDGWMDGQTDRQMDGWIER